jgi:drug/metabolite transporter (DMT)-like permease
MLYLKLVLMAVFWSGVFPAVTLVLRSMDLFTSIVLRFGSGALILLMLVRWRARHWPQLSQREWLLVLALGLIGISLYNTLFTAGLALVEASRAALIVPTNPALTALLAALFLRERLGWLRTVGVALSMAGALWVLCRGDPLALRTVQFGLGELYLVLCILTWCIYTLLGRLALASMSALTLTAYVMAVGVLPLTALAWNEPRQLTEVTWVSWTALAYLVVFGTVIPFLWYYEGVKALGAARAAQFINLVPPIAVLESIWLLDEPWTSALGWGVVFVVVGLYLTNRTPHQ